VVKNLGIFCAWMAASAPAFDPAGQVPSLPP
jgi:hypothetical protein